MPDYRVYIDESGDHTYRHLDDLSRRYLGLTGVVIRQAYYNPRIPEILEELKKKYFHYDPDSPPIFVRKFLILRKRSFWVLRDKAVNQAWEADLLGFLSILRAQIFTVVIDKKEHRERFPVDAWNPYSYSLAVLLNRIRGYLNLKNATADIMPESRGTSEDNQLLAEYVKIRVEGSGMATGAEYRAVFPDEGLLFRKKELNVAGLQLADLIAAEQKMLTVQEHGKPLSSPIGPFGNRLNDAINNKVNKYGRYFLE